VVLRKGVEGEDQWNQVQSQVQVPGGVARACSISLVALIAFNECHTPHLTHCSSRITAPSAGTHDLTAGRPWDILQVRSVTLEHRSKRRSRSVPLKECRPLW